MQAYIQKAFEQHDIMVVTAQTQSLRLKSPALCFLILYTGRVRSMRVGFREQRAIRSS